MFRLIASFIFLLSAWPSAAFTSLHVFGDSASSVTYGLGDPLYYNGRSCNGRIWTEVLAQRQGLPFETNKTIAFFGHYSDILLTNVTTYPPPPDASTALCVVWVNNADFVGMIFSNSPPYISNAATMTFWTNRMNLSLANHSNVIQTLYAKGLRTLLMPNVVDLGQTPFLNGADASSRAFIRQRIVSYNVAFTNLLTQAQLANPGLVIRSPDLFSLLDIIVTNAGAYGLTNALSAGVMVDALTDATPAFANKAFNGPCTNHIFWDYINPGAKAQAIVANIAHQSLTPVRWTNIARLTGSNRLDAVNLPIGQAGFIEAGTNFTQWSAALAISPTNSSQSFFLVPSGPQQFYRQRFTHDWAWP
jgi:phospholipase/lecithinase/hemolysin